MVQHREMILVGASFIAAVALAISPIARSAQSSQASITLNLKNASISQAVELVRRLTGKEVSYDSSVDARMTVSGYAPIPADALYEVMIDVMHANGIETRILDGRAFAYLPVSSRNRPAMLVHITSTKNRDVHEIDQKLRPFLSNHGIITENAAAGVLIIADTEEPMRLIRAALNESDSDAKQAPAVTRSQ